MGEPFDHGPAGWIRESRKCCVQLIHNRMVVDYRSMSSEDFGVSDFCFLISGHLTPALIYAWYRLAMARLWHRKPGFEGRRPHDKQTGTRILKLLAESKTEPARSCFGAITRVDGVD